MVSETSEMMFGVRASCCFRANFAVCLMVWDPLFSERPFLHPDLSFSVSCHTPSPIQSVAHHTPDDEDQVEISHQQRLTLNKDAVTRACFWQLPLPSLMGAVTLVTGT